MYCHVAHTIQLNLIAFSTYSSRAVVITSLAIMVAVGALNFDNLTAHTQLLLLKQLQHAQGLVLDCRVLVHERRRQLFILLGSVGICERDVEYGMAKGYAV